MLTGGKLSSGSMLHRVTVGHGVLGSTRPTGGSTMSHAKPHYPTNRDACDRRNIDRVSRTLAKA